MKVELSSSSKPKKSVKKTAKKSGRGRGRPVTSTTTELIHETANMVREIHQKLFGES